MNNRPLQPGRFRRALPALVLLAIAAALAVSSIALAEPIVTVPPVDVGGTEVSGSAESDPQADACVGDRHSGADPADPSIVALNDSACQSGVGGAGTGAGAGTKPSGASGTTGRTGTSGAAATTVSAADAVGLRIAGVRKLMKHVTLTRNFRLLVTIRDARGRLVKGAIVSAGRVPGSQNTLAGLHADFTNKHGVAALLVPVTKRMFGKKLFVKVAARTPRARAVALRSVLLPRLR